MLAGRQSLASIQRWGQFPTQKQRAALGWPSHRAGTLRPAPSDSALYHLLCKVDPHGFAATLTGWLAAARGTLPRGLAVDGRYVRTLVVREETVAKTARKRFKVNAGKPCAHSTVPALSLNHGKSIK